MDPDGKGGPAGPPQPGPVLLLQVHHHQVLALCTHCKHATDDEFAWVSPAHQRRGTRRGDNNGEQEGGKTS